MELTRHKHLRYLNWMSPILVILYFIQILLYAEFAPPEMQEEIRLMLGLGLIIIIGIFGINHHQYRIFMRQNVIEINFFNTKEEILYQEIAKHEIIATHFGLNHLKLTLRDGTFRCLYSIDCPDQVLEMMRNKASF